jgi:hypothetical protein
MHFHSHGRGAKAAAGSQQGFEPDLSGPRRASAGSMTVNGGGFEADPSRQQGWLQWLWKAVVPASPESTTTTGPCR